MQALCPKCNAIKKISRKQLKNKHRKVNCHECKHQYNARIALINDPRKHHRLDQEGVEELVIEPREVPPVASPIDTHTNNTAIELYAWQKEKKNIHPVYWLTGVVLSISLFIGQLYYFKGYLLSQNPQIRPLLTILNSWVNYPLPAYHKPHKYSTIGSSLTPSGKKHHRLKISLINHADFKQPPPFIFLTLYNLSGGVMSQRLFSPEQYLSKTDPINLVERSAILDIDFHIANTVKEIGGYSVMLK